MARGVPENPSEQGIAEASTSACILQEPECFMRKWYFTRQEIEDHSPSRRDGISLKRESQLRGLYCSFIDEIGKRLELSQTIIACGMLLCHRFYMRQSHAKNDWQIIATSSFFLAGKIQGIPRRKSIDGIQHSFLREVVVDSYQIQHKFDSSASQRIRKTEVFNKQKELILVGERVVLSTIGFDLDIQLPYSSLFAALKSLNLLVELDRISDLGQIALNFVNDCHRTSMCLQYKPQYIAAASVALAAEIKKVKLPTQQGKVWWLEFDVSPKKLNEVIRQMIRPDRKQVSPPKNMKAIKSETSHRKPSGTVENVGSESKPMRRELDNPNPSGTVDNVGSESKPMRGGLDDPKSSGAIENVGSESKQMSGELDDPKPSGTIENVGSESKQMRGELDNPKSSCTVENVGSESKQMRGELDDPKSRCQILPVENNCKKIDIDRIRELKRRRCEKAASKKLVSVNDELDTEAWIESELENGLEIGDTSSNK